MEINDATTVSKYRFGTETADFYVCSICGVVPFATSEIAESLYAVVNVNTFEETDTLSITGSPSDFDGEQLGTRLDRRKQNWIPEVRISLAVA